MPITLGYKRATIVILDENGKATAEKFVLEGKPGQGGTVSANISGLASEPVKKWASNVAYYLLAKGTGDVKAELAMLDIPAATLDKMLGRKKHADGFTVIGESTEPPYVAVLLESETNGEPEFMGLLKGKLSMDSKEYETRTENNPEPADEVLTLDCVANENGDVAITDIGEDQRVKVEAYIFPVAP